MPQFRRLASAVAFAVLAGCGNPNDLAAPSIANVENQVTLYALTGTPITTPSAYSIADSRAIRIDQNAGFDFAFNIDPAGSAVFLPLPVLGLGVSSGINAGFLLVSDTFDGILTAPQNGYVTADTVHIDVGQRYIVRSRVVCSSLGVPMYGKIEVSSIDAAARTVTFRVLADDNCGYKDLQPGFPVH